MRRLSLFCLTMVVGFGVCGRASAALVTIANWTFETSAPTTAGPHVAEGGLQAGVAPAIGFHTSGSTVYSTPVGNGSARSFSSNTWTTIGDYYRFQVDLTGYQNAVVSWDQTRSGTGPAAFELQYSTNGTTFTTLNSYTVLANTAPPAPGVWNGTTAYSYYSFGPISLTSAVDNEATVYVRMRSTVTAATAGTNRVDNILIQAEQIPEPSTLSMLGLAVTAVSMIRSRRK
ncbi:MAG: PEP-CTERM sorting domain-containing protein [Pirellulaceae bacterium]|nr:PEP-CTERM sorting domain-containing protein [Pirellulaceae bacterium]